MSKIAERAKARRLAVREEIRQRCPHLLPAARSLARVDRSAIVLGRNERAAPVSLPLRARLEHMHAIGTTGGGKSSFLQHCVRQDIADGRGVLYVDPHGDHPGSGYQSILAWLDAKGYAETRTIHLIDPNAPTHTVGFNPLEWLDPETDLSVVAGVALEAFERVWGGEDTQTKPTIRRLLKATFMALAELGLTLVEAGLLFDPDDAAGVRAWVIDRVTNPYAQDELKRLDQLARDPRTRRDFGMEVVGPINRLAEFVSSSAVRSIVGQTQNTIDLCKAMDEGHIILANLSGGSRVYERDADLLGRLLTRFLFFHAKRRRYPERAFFAYLDECHRYLSGDLENILAELRKFGCGAVLSHQWQAQLARDDENMLAAVRNATNVKVAFRIKDPVEATELADMVLNYNLEMPVHTLTKPTVVGHRLVKLKSESASEQSAISKMQSETEGRSVTESCGSAESTADTVGEAISSAQSDAAMNAESASNASASGTGAGSAITNTLSVDTNLFGIPTVIGVAEGQSAQSNQSNMTGSASSRGRSSSSSSGRSSSTARTTASSTSESVAHTASSSRSVGSAHTLGQARTQGQQETFEPLYEDRPTSVHSLENVRYMAGQILCNLTTGRAAISFVDAGGMKRASLTVANVEPHTLPSTEFEKLRERVFATSPSATPVGAAIEKIAARKKALIEAASKARTPDEPPTPAHYRTKKHRPVTRQASRRLHGLRNATGNLPGQGRPTAVASGDRDP